MASGGPEWDEVQAAGVRALPQAQVDAQPGPQRPSPHPHNATRLQPPDQSQMVGPLF